MEKQTKKEIEDFFKELEKYFYEAREEENYYPKSSIKEVLKNGIK
jgi:hypothetical protein